MVYIIFHVLSVSQQQYFKINLFRFITACCRIARCWVLPLLWENMDFKWKWWRWFNFIFATHVTKLPSTIVHALFQQSAVASSNVESLNINLSHTVTCVDIQQIFVSYIQISSVIIGFWTIWLTCHFNIHNKFPKNRL